MSIVDKRRVNADPDDYNEQFAQEAQRLLVILHGRIQTFLKELLKSFKTNSSKKTLYQEYKEMFAVFLRLKEDSSSFSADLLSAMERFQSFFEKQVTD